MATFTLNFNFRKPAGVDLVNVDTDINQSMDLIDTNLKDNNDAVASALVDLSTAVADFDAAVVGFPAAFPPFARIVKNGPNQAITTSVITPVTFNSTLVSRPASVASTTANALTISQAGWYDVEAMMTLDTAFASSGTVQLMLIKTNAANPFGKLLRIRSAGIANSTVQRLQAKWFEPFELNDKLSLSFIHNVGTTRDILYTHSAINPPIQDEDECSLSALYVMGLF